MTKNIVIVGYMAIATKTWWFCSLVPGPVLFLVARKMRKRQGAWEQG